jgi:arginine deiminase
MSKQGNETVGTRNKRMDLRVDSEIGALEAVILHSPGLEVEHMEPRNAEKALYSDILNLSIAQQEYAELYMVLSKTARTFEIRDLLRDVLMDQNISLLVLSALIEGECSPGLKAEHLAALPPDTAARMLIEGVLMEPACLTDFLSEETFSLKPLHNLLFIRDTAMVLGNRVLAGQMASRVRRREARIAAAVFAHHPMFQSEPVAPFNDAALLGAANIEGGDVLVAREDILVVGIGSRTTSEGVDFIASHFCGPDSKIQHIMVQELPQTPESFIHLDMVFTFLDRNLCMVYEPLLLKDYRRLPIHITVENGSVSVVREDCHLAAALNKLGMDLKTVSCGGKDERHQQREQWHSGANFFALAPGKVIGYARNEHTLDALNREGFAILSAQDIISGRDDILSHEKCVVAVRGSELARGGGGCRCLTLPLRRKPV